MENQKAHNVVKSPTFLMENLLSHPGMQCISQESWAHTPPCLSHTLTHIHVLTLFQFKAFPSACSIVILSQLVSCPTSARGLSRTQN